MASRAVHRAYLRCTYRAAAARSLSARIVHRIFLGFVFADSVFVMVKPVREAIAAVAQAMGLDDAAIARRMAFLEFGDEDVRLLQALHGRLREARRSFVDGFYDHLLKFEETRRFIPDTETLNKLKQTQSVYFDSLTAGDYGREYVYGRLRVGMVHERVGLDLQWYIGAYNKYLSGLLPEVWRLLGGDPRKFLDAYRALQKIVLLDMGLAIDTYIYADKQTIDDLKTYAEDIIASLPVGILVLDEDLRVHEANRALSGLVDRDASGARLDEVLPIPELKEKVEHLLLTRGGEETQIEAALDGKYLQITMAAITRRKGGVSCLLLRTSLIARASSPVCCIWLCMMRLRACLTVISWTIA